MKKWIISVFFTILLCLLSTQFLHIGCKNSNNINNNADKLYNKSSYNPTGEPIGGGIGYSDNGGYDANNCIDNKADLLSALENASPNTTISICGNAEIIFDSTDFFPSEDDPSTSYDERDGISPIIIPADVKLVSNRGFGGSEGALLKSTCYIIKPKKPQPLILLNGNNIRIYGLRIEGPNTYIDPNTYEKVYNGKKEYNDKITCQECECENDCEEGCGSCVCNDQDLCPIIYGITSWEGSQYPRPYPNGANNFKIDNCEISAWDFAISLSIDMDSPRVHHNFIHHNLRWGNGYGIGVNQTTAYIEGNIFAWGRHAIAGINGMPGSSYIIRYNIFLPTFYMYPVDMHGIPVTLNNGTVKWFAGTLLNISHNMFYTFWKGWDYKGYNADDSYLGSIHLEDIPEIGCNIIDNWFLQDKEKAISQDVHFWDSDINDWDYHRYFWPDSNIQNIAVYQNKFEINSWANVEGNTSAKYKTGEFNNDGKIDIVEFQSNSHFYVQLSNGLGFNDPVEWGYNGNYLDPQRYKIGDVNGDGMSDIVSFDDNGVQDIFDVWFSRGDSFDGSYTWGSNGAILEEPTEKYKIMDVNGDGAADLLSLENDSIYVWFSRPYDSGTKAQLDGSWHWADTQNYYTDINKFKFGDVTGDGYTDMVGIVESGSQDFIYVWESDDYDHGGYTKTQVIGPSHKKTNGFNYGPEHYRLEDVNGDVYMDLLSIEINNGGVYKWISDEDENGLYFINDPIRWFDYQYIPTESQLYNTPCEIPAELNGGVKIECCE